MFSAVILSAGVWTVRCQSVIPQRLEFGIICNTGYPLLHNKVVSYCSYLSCELPQYLHRMWFTTGKLSFYAPFAQNV
jgi:hypothetical protein